MQVFEHRFNNLIKVQAIYISEPLLMLHRLFKVGFRQQQLTSFNLKNKPLNPNGHLALKRQNFGGKTGCIKGDQY